MIFTFYTESGEFAMDYRDYLRNEDLRRAVTDDSRVSVNLGLRVLSFDRRWLGEHPKQKSFVDHMAHERDENPLRFFLPHCAMYDDFNTPSHQFINDDTNIYTAIVSGNRFGKTTLAWIKALLRYGLIQVDPEWECYKYHGVKFTPYQGPREIAVVSYMWDSHRETLWPKIIKTWTPKRVIKDYLNWNVPQKATACTLELTDGFILSLKACSQPQVAFESGAFDGMVWDEQGVEAKFDGADARLKTRRRYYRDMEGFERLSRGFHVGGMTPHKVEGRPDTGAGTWLHRMANGEETRGITSKFYYGDLIKAVPDWVYPERQKLADLSALDEAQTRLDRKRVRQIRSRLYGEWESTGGAVFDEFDEEVHVVDDFDIPGHWCAIRGIDHGRRNPTACLSIAITPEQDYVVFREYLGIGQVISTCVHEIVRRAGNMLTPLPDLDLRTHIVKRWEEDYTNERYIADVLDGRTFKSPDSNSQLLIGDIYRNSGLTRVRAAVIGDEQPGIMLIKELLKINPDRLHLVTKQPGAPRIYFMRGCKLTRRAMQDYRNKPEVNNDGNPSEKPQGENNHIPDALRYAIESRIGYKPEVPFKNPINIGGKNEKQRPKGYTVPEDKRAESRPRGGRYDRYTGYPLRG